MKLINNIVEPKEIGILWQPSIDGNTQKPAGERFIVGKITNAGEQAELVYFNSSDVEQAEKQGFTGLTAYPFDSKNNTHKGGIESVLSRRLPPDSRGDYDYFLRSYRISPDAAKSASPLTLLAYTVGNIMGDGFSFYPIYEENIFPSEFSFEIAGFRHNGKLHYPEPKVLQDKEISFELDDSNAYDKSAIKVMLDGKNLGYVPKGLNTLIRNILQAKKISAVIERINGTLERPSVLVFCTVG